MIDTRYHIEFGQCDLCDGLGEVATHQSIGLTLCGDCLTPVVTSPRPPTTDFRPKYMEAWLKLMGMTDLFS